MSDSDDFKVWPILPSRVTPPSEFDHSLPDWFNSDELTSSEKLRLEAIYWRG